MIEKMDIDELKVYRAKLVEQREQLKIDYILEEMDLISRLLEIRTFGEQQPEHEPSGVE